MRYANPLRSMSAMKAICSAMWSVALHSTVGGSMLSSRMSARKASVYSAAISHAVLPVRREPFSILSSPVSASEVRWPTSVMFITWLTTRPFQTSTRFSTSSNRNVRKLPMCW